MPELPEVETIRRQLETILLGKTIQSVEVRTKKVFIGDPKQLVGQKIIGFRRFGKMLLIDFTDHLSLAIHLKMTGRLVYSNSKNQSASWRTKIKNVWEVDYPTDRHTLVDILLKNGDHLYYHDQRRFGWLQVVPTQKVDEVPYVKKLGPEFLKDLTLGQFTKIVHSSSKPIKLVLMDQEKMAGVGNIYANEALWWAKIHPKTKANKLLDPQIVKLFDCIEEILKQAIKWKGASENNYRDAFGQKGEVQEHFKVYARDGKPCPRCGRTIKKFKLAGRGTHFCPNCQVA